MIIFFRMDETEASLVTTPEIVKDVDKFTIKEADTTYASNDLLNQMYGATNELDDDDLMCIKMMQEDEDFHIALQLGNGKFVETRTTDEIIQDYNIKKDKESETFRMRYLGLPPLKEGK